MNRPRPAFASWVVAARRDLQSIRASPSGVPFPWCSAARKRTCPPSVVTVRPPTPHRTWFVSRSPVTPRAAGTGPQRLPGLRSSTQPQNSSGAVRPARRPTPAPDARSPPSAAVHAVAIRGGDRPGGAEHGWYARPARGGSGPRAPIPSPTASSKPAPGTLQKIVLNPLAAYGVLGQTVRARRPEGDRRPGAEECVRIEG